LKESSFKVKNLKYAFQELPHPEDTAKSREEEREWFIKQPISK
jgi:hypothetical protein